MADKPLERKTLEEMKEEIEQAKQIAESRDVPLTIERIAAQLGMDLETVHRILEGSYPLNSKLSRKKAELLCRAGEEATASVVEHAMRRGSSANMHMLYLRNNAGYDRERKEKIDGFPPVVFVGEEDISE